MDEYTKIISLKEELFNLRYDVWINKIVFSEQWWFLLLTSIIFWSIWWKFVNRNRLPQLLIVGLLSALIATLLDDLGTVLILWSYKYSVLPLTPRLNPINLSVLPVCYMLLIQWFKRWSNYFIALIVLSFGGSFIAEPFFVKIGIYDPIHWKYIYSFPIYILIGCFLKWFVGILPVTKEGDERALQK